MQPTLVAWIDAQADAEHWTTAADLEHKPRIIRTIGYDIGEQVPGHLSLASSWDAESGCYGHVMHIPSACIVERYDMNVAVPIEGLD